jgi:hypothetical protein
VAGMIFDRLGIIPLEIVIDHGTTA